MWFRVLGFLTGLSLLSACGSTEDSLRVDVSAYGESFVEDGIPASAFEDDWSVRFERFVVHFEEISIGDQRITGLEPLDLAQSSDGAGHFLDELQVLGTQSDAIAFSITRVDIEGVAHKDDVSKRFAWLFDQPVRYARCEAAPRELDATSAALEITLHADHLFFDSLVSAEPSMRFQPLADADADQDGEITPSELMNTDIGSYDSGSQGGLDDLWSFLGAQIRSLGHVNGEAHCMTADNVGA